MTKKELLQRLDQLLQYGKQSLDTTHMYDRVEYVTSESRDKFRSGSMAFIHKLFDGKSPYFSEFEHATRGYHPSDIKQGLAILASIKDEIEGNWLVSIKDMISAEIFADFIEMAEYLLSSHYKDPSAVILGSVLEEHLRQLAIKNAIDIKVEKNGKMVPKKADTLNVELCKTNVYNMIDQKQVTAWLDLRNNAAHGNYSEYTEEQVINMLQGIVNFISRTK